MTPASFGRGAAVIVAAATTVLALGAAEAVLRVFAPLPDPYVEQKIRRVTNQYIRSEFPVNMRLRTEVEAGLPGIEGTNTFSTNNLGFRGDSLARPKPAGEYRVFLLGGSTVEGFYLDDANALDAVVQRELQRTAPAGTVVKVYNAARSGDRSDDHVSMFAHRVAHLEPDAIVVMAGVNDLSSSIYEYDFLHYVVRGPSGETAPDTLSGIRLLRVASTELQLSRRLFYLLKRATPRTDDEVARDIPLKSDYRAAVERRRAGQPTDDDPPTEPDVLRANLNTIVGGAVAAGIRVVLVTQQSTWSNESDPRADEWQWMRHRNERTWSAAKMHAALERLNEVTRDVARRERTGLLDLSRTLPASFDHFYDDVHFTTLGARTAGEQIAALMRSVGVVPVARD